MEKDFTLNELFDLYGGLLTARQKELFESYYLYDLSLSEIAQPEGKTRQNVYEQVKVVKAKLLEYEKVLGQHGKNRELIDLATSIENTNPEISKKIKEIIGK